VENGRHRVGGLQAGKIEHPRSLYDRYGANGQSLPWLKANVDPHARRVEMPDKLKYVWCYDAALREKLAAVAQPFPKRAESIASDAPTVQVGEGGAIPTSALHPSLDG
jgi:hypothetical protein